MKLAYHSFQGTAPRISPRLLPETYSQEADNVKLWSGELRPFYGDLQIKQVPRTTLSIFKYRSSSNSDIWLNWNSDVNVVKDPVINDEFNRIIISGLSGGLRITDSTYVGTTSGTIDSTNSLTLSVPRPEKQMGMSVSGSIPEQNPPAPESRTYVAVWVREWQDGKLDLSAPSNPAKTSAGKTFIDVVPGQTVHLTNIVLPTNAYNTARIRKGQVYRSSVGSDGSVSYRYVGEFATNPTQTVYDLFDTVDTLDLGEVLVSLEWDAPISSLSGIISLHNGVLAAFNKNDLYFSYPFQSHAWPTTYRVSFDHQIVGLGSFGNNVVVCTTSNPAIVLVGDPAAASVQPIAESIPCSSARSIVSSVSGVLYATKNGLCRINSSEPEIISDPYYTRDEWIPLNPESLISAIYDRCYFGFYRRPTKRWGFTFDLDLTTLGFVHLAKNVRAVWTDPEDLALYLVVDLSTTNTSIVKFDSDTNTRRSFKWRSKIDISTEGLQTFSAARVRAEYLGGTGISIGYIPPYVFVNNALNDLMVNVIEVNGTVNMETVYANLKVQNSAIFRYFVDGRLKYEKQCVDILPFRLPSGFRGWESELEIVSEIPVHYIEIATSMAELT